jgi:uncharacterized ferredoxin-like protein
MATKFEREMQGRATRAIRQDNIDKINAMIKETEDVLSVVPRDNELTNIHDAAFLRDRLAWLNEMLQDEQAAYKATFAADEAEASAFTASLK